MRPPNRRPFLPKLFTHASTVALMTAATALATGTVTLRTALHVDAALELGVANVEIATVAVPDGTPDSIRVVVPRAGREHELVLTRRSLRAPDFLLRVYRDGVTRTIDPPAPATYTGVVSGDPSSSVAGGLVGGDLWFRVVTGDAQVWWIEPLARVLPNAAPPHTSRNHTWHVVYDGDRPFPDGRGCGLDDDIAPFRHHDGANSVGDVETVPCDLHLTEIAFDVDFPYFVSMGSDVAVTTANVEAHLMVVDEHYARDVRITYLLTDLIIRQTQIYFPDATNPILDLFRNEWNANQTGVPRDIAHLMTGQPTPCCAGIAYVGVVCNIPWAYGWSVDHSGVISHEIGHNWSAGHCHDNAPCNNMCGACLLIAPNTKNVIEAFRDSRTCLDVVPGGHTTPVPPYAQPDVVVLSRDQALARTRVVVDVLDNDHDANCDVIAIDAHDPASQLGSAVDRSTGTGPGGRDEISYTPPCVPFAGTDRFEYTAGDGSGGTATTWVTADVREPSMVGYWRLDDAVGSAAVDDTALGRHGVLMGTAPATWNTGRHAGGLQLDGVDQYVAVPGSAIDGTEVTITAWLNRNGPQAQFTGLVYSRASGTTAGLHLGAANELRYTWRDDPATYNWNSGLVVPDGQWVFAALAIEPSQATLYLWDGTSLQQATNTIAHGRQTFAGEISVGRDPAGGGRYFDGTLDDIRMYDHALDAAALTTLARDGGRATAPRPRDGGFESDPDAVLTWSPGLAADSYDVYFGSDYVAVRDATIASPEFRGIQITTTYNPDGLFTSGITYFWRVDTRVGASLLQGDVWLFTFNGTADGVVAYWPLDDGGATAADVSNSGRDGALQGGATWAAGRHVGGLAFDGIDDHVLTPGLDLARIDTTIVLWVHRFGDQNPWAGLLFSRAPETTAGFNFGNLNELRYHWGIGARDWGWDSGLIVPDATWTLVALVVEPDQATIYMNDGGGWQSAVNVTPHVIQDFAGDTYLGRDPTSAARSFRGTLDDVRVYNYALSAADLDELFTLGGRALAPSPNDGVRLATHTGPVSWVAGLGANAHDVYFGTDLAAVQTATTTSPEFVGNQTTTSVDIGRTEPGQTYYWRIDERVGATIVSGNVWRFSIAAAVGGSLRAVKGPGGDPHLSWRELGNNNTYEVRRCDAAAGSCTPTGVDVVGPYRSDWPDPAAVERTIWYQVGPTNACWP